MFGACFHFYNDDDDDDIISIIISLFAENEMSNNTRM